MTRTTIFKAAALFVLLCACAPALAKARRVAAIAYDITRKDMDEKQWKSYVRRQRSWYEDWVNDNPSGSFKRFLDDKLLQIALGVPKGKIKTLKKFVYWLAMYKHFGEPAPSYIRNIADKNRQDLDNLLEDFSWERASKLVRKKSKGYDEEKIRDMAKKKEKKKKR